MNTSEVGVADLACEIRGHATRITKAMHKLLTDLRQFDAARGWHIQGADSCAHWLSRELGLGQSTAHERIRVSRALGRLRIIDAAFASGELSYSKVRAITRVATLETEELLVSVARTTSGADLEVFCRRFRGKERRPPPPTRFVRRRTIAKLAKIRIEIQLDPDEAEDAWNALVRAADLSGVAPGDPSGVGRVVQALASLAPRDDAPRCAPIEELSDGCGAEPDRGDSARTDDGDSVTLACAEPSSAPG